MDLGMPYVHIWNILHIDRSGASPACFFPWPYETTGEFVEAGDLTTERLAQLIQKVGQNPSYRDRACYFQRVIARTHGLDLAADVVERAFKKNQIVDSARRPAAPLHT